MMEREDEAWCSCSPRQCRICHEEEGDDGCATATAMESPCGCSGSLKYAHRGCVQRWCDEKGSAVCEICLQGCPGPVHPIPFDSSQPTRFRRHEVTLVELKTRGRRRPNRQLQTLVSLPNRRPLLENATAAGGRRPAAERRPQAGGTSRFSCSRRLSRHCGGRRRPSTRDLYHSSQATKWKLWRSLQRWKRKQKRWLFTASCSPRCPRTSRSPSPSSPSAMADI